MKLPSPFAALCLAVVLVMCRAAGAADEHGHDHGNEAPVTGPALPRFAAASETFELVGVLNGKHITLYLDRAADNTPVTEAQIELEIGGAKLKAQKRGSDEFEVMLASEPQPGLVPVTATVTAGSEVDLLAGEFDIHAAAAVGESARTRSWTRYAGWAAGAAAGLIGLILIGRWVVASRKLHPPQAGGAA